MDACRVGPLVYHHHIRVIKTLNPGVQVECKQHRIRDPTPFVET